MLPKNIRRLPRHNVPQYAPAHAGEHAQKYRQEPVIPVSRHHRRVDPRHRKRAQAHGVENVHNPLIHLDGPALQNHLVQPHHGEQDEHGQKARDHIDRIHKQRRGYISQDNVPQHTAAHRRGHAQHHHAQQIQLLLDRHHGPRGGKCHRPDHFYDKKYGYILHSDSFPLISFLTQRGY